MGEAPVASGPALESPFLEVDGLTDAASLSEPDWRERRQPADYARQGTTQADAYQRAIVRGARRAIYADLHRRFAFRGVMLEIGAGSCWVASLLSREPAVERIHAVDYSRHLLSVTAPEIMRWLDARPHKITRILADFYRVDYRPETFDFVVVDSTLHHATDLTRLLRRVAAMMKREAVLLALRKPVLPAWRPGLRRSFAAAERANGAVGRLFPRYVLVGRRR
jgi:ubiquinone/menaquinone biosynthesis C-methylase UbiE